MARGSRRTRTTSWNGRDTFDIASPRLSVSSVFAPSSAFTRSSLLREVEDRRTWHPEGLYRPARSFNVPRHRLIVPATAPLSKNVSPAVAFAQPSKVLVCVRRSARREVIFAKGRAGGGA